MKFTELCYCRNCGCAVANDTHLCDLCGFGACCCAHSVTRIEYGRGGRVLSQRQSDVDALRRADNIVRASLQRYREQEEQRLAAERADEQVARRPIAQIEVVLAGLRAQIRGARISSGLSQRKLAEVSGVGEKTISSFETGARIGSIKVDQLVRILTACGVAINLDAAIRKEAA